MTIWQKLQGAFDHYRPDRHYMRGPGPKWRERHAGSKPSGGLAGPIVNDEVAHRIVTRRVDTALPHIEYPLWGGDWR